MLIVLCTVRCLMFGVVTLV